MLVCTDGWAAYPASIRRAFGEKVKHSAGPGRACLQIWPQLHIGTVIKQTVKKRVSAITRQMAHGVLEQAQLLLKASGGGTVLNTAFIERLNGTMRERLAALTRKSGHAASRLEALHTGMYPASLYLQFLLAASPIKQGPRWPERKTTFWTSPDSCYGGRTHRSCLECLGIDELQNRSSCVGRAKTAGASTHAARACSGSAQATTRTPADPTVTRPNCAETTARSPSQGCLMLNHQIVGFYHAASLSNQLAITYSFP